MTSIFDETLLLRPEGLEEQRFSLVRRGGKLALKAKSPLFERIFQDRTKGEFLQSALWGGPCYAYSVDPGLEQGLNGIGCSLRFYDTFWKTNNNYGGPIFNLTFLLAKGLSNGLVFPLKDQIPLSLIEGPSYVFANTLKQGIYLVAKNLAFDFEVTVQMQTSTKFGGSI